MGFRTKDQPQHDDTGAHQAPGPVEIGPTGPEVDQNVSMDESTPGIDTTGNGDDQGLLEETWLPEDTNLSFSQKNVKKSQKSPRKTPYKTRKGREIKKPRWQKDFCM